MNREQEISICIIKEAHLEFLSEISLLASKYAKKRGMKGFMRNTPDGLYEIFMTAKEVK